MAKKKRAAGKKSKTKGGKKMKARKTKAKARPKAKAKAKTPARGRVSASATPSRNLSDKDLSSGVKADALFDDFNIRTVADKKADMRDVVQSAQGDGRRANFDVTKGDAHTKDHQG